MNTFYHGDCLFVLKHDLDPESIDLIYLDPPFFTGKVQKGTMRWQPGAMEVSYEDSRRFWSQKADVMREQSPAWLRHIALKRPDFASYLWYMMERLQACHKVLKKTGSIYLHCDYRASHYLKMIMDEIFGDDNLRNEIIWKRTPFAGSSKSKARQLPKSHDTIYFYSKGKEWIWNAPVQPYSEEYLGRFKWRDERGYYRKTLLKTYSEETLERLRQEERLVEPTKAGAKYSYKQYLNESAGYRQIDDMWTDIDMINPVAKERTGYPTQKPEALLERIIKASSDEDELVLDPFCGCGTSVIVAGKLNRRFIGIDIHPTAFEVIKNRGHELFAQSRYISRDLEEVSAMHPREFEDWVNEFYRATKPSPDRGVDGITHEGIPIQVKTFQIKYDTIDKLLSSSKFHPLVPKPIKKLIFVSQTGFDDGARKRKFEIETAEGIEVVLTTPEQMLSLA